MQILPCTREHILSAVALLGDRAPDDANHADALACYLEYLATVDRC